MMASFSDAVLNHFRNPRNSGELEHATHHAEVANPICGDLLQLAARVENGRIAELRFLCRGCATAIACASWMTEQVIGKSVDEARAVNTEMIATGLGGLPEETKHGAALAADAVKALLLKQL